MRATGLFGVILASKRFQISTEMGKTKSSNSSQKVQSEKVSLKFFRLAFKNPTSCSAKRSTMSSTSPSQNIGPVGLNPFLIGDEKLLKPALQLMNVFRLKIDEIKEDEVFTSYTRWLESVQVRGTENQEVYVTFSQRFERIWLELKKRLPQHVVKEPKNQPILVYEANIRSACTLGPKNTHRSARNTFLWRICESCSDWSP
jgi:hypothetical protein